MPVTELTHPIVKQRLGILRSRPPSLVFRNHTRDLCRFLAYEATQDLSLIKECVKGWSGPVEVHKLEDKTPTAVPILRAGLGMLQGFLDIFPEAPVSMAGLFRNEETLEPVSYYHNLVSDISERKAFILDPMLATGGSTNAAIELLKKANCPKIYGLFLIASAKGIETVLEKHPDVHIYTCAIDEELNDKGYILPGLGDAGDLIFGT